MPLGLLPCTCMAPELSACQALYLSLPPSILLHRLSDARSASGTGQFVLPGEAEAEQTAHATGARRRRRECHLLPASLPKSSPGSTNPLPCRRAVQPCVEPFHACKPSQHAPPPWPPAAGSRRVVRQGEAGAVVRAQKAYEFAVDVTAGPPDSMFRCEGQRDMPKEGGAEAGSVRMGGVGLTVLLWMGASGTICGVCNSRTALEQRSTLDLLAAPSLHALLPAPRLRRQAPAFHRPSRHTKLLTLKPKYMIENQTGLPMLMKQFRTPDPECGWWGGGGCEGDAARFARALPPGSRQAAGPARGVEGLGRAGLQAGGPRQTARRPACRRSPAVHKGSAGCRWCAFSAVPAPARCPRTLPQGGCVLGRRGAGAGAGGAARPAGRGGRLALERWAGRRAGGWWHLPWRPLAVARSPPCHVIAPPASRERAAQTFVPVGRVDHWWAPTPTPPPHTH